ncbi:MAG TPA: hypothetical protein VF157_05095, partial [Chloroflexota bacterium]
KHDPLLFEYVSLVKRPDCFDFEPVAEFIVDRTSGDLQERSLESTTSVRQAHRASPVHEGTRPGSYVPLAR